MTREMRANQFVVPGPFVFRIGRGMNSDKSTAGLYKSLKGGLLVGIEDVPGSIVENDRLVLFKVEVIKERRIFCRVNQKAVVAAQLEDGLDAAGNRRVFPAFCL